MWGLVQLSSVHLNTAELGQQWLIWVSLLGVDQSKMKWSIMMIECYKSTQKCFNQLPEW